MVADPDPYVFRAPGTGSRYFYHKAKIVTKILIPTVLWLLYDFLWMMYDVNVLSKSNKRENLGNKIVFCSLLENNSIRIRGSGPKCQGISSIGFSNMSSSGSLFRMPEHWGIQSRRQSL
jgi:hypothetical protein